MPSTDTACPDPRLVGGLTRRRLLGVGGAGVIAAWLGPLGRARAFAATADATPDVLRRSAYAGLTGTRFTLSGDDARIALTLTRVGDVAGAQRDAALRGSDDAFVLEFDGPLDPVVGQGVHTLTHDRLGSFALFVVPTGDRDHARQRYEVVVDRSVALPRNPPEREHAAADAPRPGATAAKAKPKAKAPHKAKAKAKATVKRRRRPKHRRHARRHRAT